MMAAPLLMSSDLRVVKPEIKEILLNKHVISIDQNKYGIMAEVKVKNADNTEVWHRPLDNRKKPKQHAVLFFNRNDQPTKMKHTLEQVLGQKVGHRKRYDGFDLWENYKALGTFKGSDSLEFEVPAHGVKMLKFVRSR